MKDAFYNWRPKINEDDDIQVYQRPWVGLTDEEIDTWNIVGHESLRDFIRAIEAKLKEKNA
jgi:hypothetical protein